MNIENHKTKVFKDDATGEWIKENAVTHEKLELDEKDYFVVGIIDLFNSDKMGYYITPDMIGECLYNEGYRKQSENVIELPCKVGTTLYFLYNSPYADKPDLTPRVYKTTDWYFEVDKTGIVINTSYIHSFNKKYDYYLGETVFLTKQEAEQALAKMKGGAE